jgi:hypothetical protein
MKDGLLTAAVTITVLGGMLILLAWPLQLLWNSCLVSAIDGVNAISFWQALGLNILASILFKDTSVRKESK